VRMKFFLELPELLLLQKFFCKMFIQKVFCLLIKVSKRNLTKDFIKKLLFLKSLFIFVDFFKSLFKILFLNFSPKFFSKVFLKKILLKVCC
jgi:hypothetical protein